MDEVSLGAATMVGELHNGAIREYETTPRISVSRCRATGCCGSRTRRSRASSSRACSPTSPGRRRDIVVLNAGVALYAANVAGSMADGVVLAREALASGKARAKLDEFIARSRAIAAQ